jgi:hypothetical protein
VYNEGMPVSFGDWIAESRKRINEWGKRGVLQSLYYVYVAALLSASNHIPMGQNVFAADWDMLIILDACRVDALHAVTSEYAFLDAIDTRWSVGSTSFEWMVHTFDQRYREEIENTAYVTGNPYPTRVFDRQYHPPVRTAIPFGPTEYDVVDRKTFRLLDEVAQYGVDDDLEAVPARTMTDRAVDVGRSLNPERLLVHYMQPHVPYLSETTIERPEFARFMRGDVTREEMWTAYVDNLRYALDDVELLLENVEAETVVITADHGEAFGEFGFYDHTIGCPHPVVRRVPWVRTSATDKGTYEPSIKPERGDLNVESHLSDLGYL